MQWESASLIWYKKLIFDSPSLWVAFKNSLIIAFSSSITAVLLGALAGIGIKWYRFKGKSYITTVSYLPMVLPEVIIGISMLIFFSAMKIRLGMFTIYVAHTTFNLPFVVMLVMARLDEFDFSTIEAARDLGQLNANFNKVIVPSIVPAIFGMLMYDDEFRRFRHYFLFRDLGRELYLSMFIQ